MAWGAYFFFGCAYLLSLKEGQPTLHEDLKLLFDEATAKELRPMGYHLHQSVEGDRGRVQTRRVWVARDAA